MKLHFALFAALFAPVAQARINEERRLEDFAALDDTLNDLKAADSGAGNRVATYHPVFDMDTDSCLPSAAISRWGKQNAGLSHHGTVTEYCRSSNFMETSNTYHRWDRTRINGVDYEVHIFDLYFEKDVCKLVNPDFCGHRHDVETVIILFSGGTPRYVSVSAHGNYDGDRTKSWSSVPKQGNHPKIVYHEEGGSTHALRFAGSGDDDVENPLDEWVMPPLASWFEMTGDNKSNAQMRSLLQGFDFGSASMKVCDNSCASEALKVRKRLNEDGVYMPYFDFGSFTGSEVKTGTFSEEGAAVDYCPTDSSQSILKGLYCFGDYCDNLQLQCTYAQNVYTDASSWTGFFSEDHGLMNCPSGYVITGIQCRGSNCDDIRLQCKRVSNKSISYSNCHETDWVSEEQGYRTIPSSAYPVGIRCGGRYCDNKKLRYCYSGGATEVNTGWFSEENGGAAYCPSQGSQSVLKGLYCDGSYCDNVRLRCTYAQDVQVTTDSSWTGWFSEEHGLRNCPTDYVVTGMGCDGSNCDNIRLLCKKVANKTIDYGRCYESDWVSEEQGYREVPDNALVVGVRCDGRYCDKKKLRYCYD